MENVWIDMVLYSIKRYVKLMEWYGFIGKTWQQSWQQEGIENVLLGKKATVHWTHWPFMTLMSPWELAFYGPWANNYETQNQLWKNKDTKSSKILSLSYIYIYIYIYIWK